ncbi:MAG: acyl carrier protein [Eubacteriales bacterium]|jgi:acyl carrier protein|nr:acyl carrier protein [Eubacteriales bacterium]MDD3611592.1 acyl carrier protein [Eubacteriales bacterium]
MITTDVQNIVADLLAVDLDEVTLDARLIEDLNADSLDAVELAMSLEEHFEITVEDDEIERMNTVNDIVNTITKHRPDLEV